MKRNNEPVGMSMDDDPETRADKTMDIEPGAGLVPWSGMKPRTKSLIQKIEVI